ncbi:ADP-dependent glucokinase/phosphofructokinase [Microbacterium betulae]|uniref:ADP-dependent glucokinase/phosphofructokinase n=1 Tax=Microbacterium betulae TaxID=2981139 RepID=A0AA97I5G3_9MICO|nr:ADP-dependent glucokinase/phosphofructokinase [Microbacterium sp. AB]WOF22062.1 ADP-dependent glucokinase/phosphofructokinase [Microbacterium sp. AB]
MRPVVLGLQGTVDYLIEWDGATIEALADEYAVAVGELAAPGSVVDERSLLVTLLSFLASGRGGERHAASSEVVERFAARFRTEVALGGTSVRAALLLRRLGVPSLLHLVSRDDTVRRLLPAECASISSATEDTLDPHLIVQYREGDGARIGEVAIVAPSANRVIVADDPPASALRLAPELGDRVAEAGVFLVSGFNTIQDEGVLRERLREIREVIARMPEGGVVVYEDAGFHDQRFAPLVSRALADVVDVFGMNEDELQARRGRTLDLLDVSAVAAAVEEMKAELGQATLVVHTRHWTVVAGERAASFAAAADAGNAAAGARYLYGDDIGDAHVSSVAARERQPAARAFAAELERRLGRRARCLPAFDLHPDRPTTIGLGDTFVGGFIAELAREDAP